ncbi:long-chain-fatty-acid--CoA ligase [Sulfobacillus harzensis]|uniref:Long-chain-fatty-acid--CoA ligase n=1 Tax=Sulfobacillus harzensis TaxID=2729629 RepID=A0A7Y0L8L2_9FIRM|nr:long-chain-fatty-acid--CoA ligase [Sulfobacillus harzensis]NMP25018.1 long-chain-fatty-acid--CoA ligase [Sulfobacillus harzensis]
MKTPLTPLALANRAFKYYDQRLAIIDGDYEETYGTWAQRIFRVARALIDSGIKPGDRVAALMPNTGPMLDMFYAVPWVGAILVPLNTRLAVDDYAYILDHSGARLVVVDVTLWPLIAPLQESLPTVWVSRGSAAGLPEYEAVLGRFSGDPLPLPDIDEDATMTLNYTSGTTARPKGVELTHRNLMANAVDFAYHLQVGLGDVYLHTLPMFHVNGWGGVWAVTGVGGVHVTLPKVDGSQIWRLIREHRVTRLCGAPAVMNIMIHSPDAAHVDQPIRLGTAGAPPPASIIERMESLGFEILHVYGLTEVSPFITVSEWLPEERHRPVAERALRSARQGIPQLLSGEVRVVRPDNTEVAEDGEELGEIVCRGNVVMKGYYQDPDATAKVLRDGWFHTGDLAIVHPDHYIEIRDRDKDIIISGGENISSVEVESVLYRHPQIQEAAVIGVPDAKWGETVKAIVVLKKDAALDPHDIIRFCRDYLAHFKAPTSVDIVAELPRTASGKVQKFILREPYWKEQTKRVN